ncbi:siroheme synthase CysG [Pleionea litopenaei]|uniref:Siroheme synthase n=1 Tax=Pleionea litopenaei TaxID=3070815 RepID=A0AA51X804_9GAMM|nr:siroheme synthase CysG [Pleionea sp. HL-JVS1]WMS88778.1 siroheme synthase CysG [Pleionea sp. HL-JVS1]
MNFFPIFTQLRGRKVLIVGAGEVAVRKLSLVYQAGAEVIVVAPELGSSLVAFVNRVNHQRLSIIEREYQSDDLNDVHLVIAATANAQVNQQVFNDAEERKLFVNVVDNSPLCSFITPAIVDRSPLTIAISSGGEAPVLARLIRGKLESWIPASYGKLAQLAAKFRHRVKAALPTGTLRKRFWENVFEGVIADKVFNNESAKAESLLQQHLQHAVNASDVPTKGEVYLVGAGPGDPDLLTFKALRLMQQADVVVYDRLVSKPILNLIRRDADRIYVGKEKAAHCVPQNEINQLLIDLANQGKRVVRLKGGDPYIFGRGGEEAQQLVKAGVAFEAVPGITSAAGTANYCGIPLTHRDFAQSVTFATGHLKNNTVDLNWPALAQSNNTLVIYMGLTGLTTISEQLINHGRLANTPVAVVQNATRPDQKVVIGDLTSIAEKVVQAKIESPAMIIIGEVVSLYDELNQPSNDLPLIEALPLIEQDDVAEPLRKIA